MSSLGKRTKNTTASLEITTFQVPPCGDGLVVGNEASIGAKGALRMLESVARGKYELIELEHEFIEAILLRKELFLRVDRETLVDTITEEVSQIMGPESLVSLKCDITVRITRSL